MGALKKCIKFTLAGVLIAVIIFQIAASLVHGDDAKPVPSPAPTTQPGIGVPTFGTVVRDDGCTVGPCPPYNRRPEITK